ncbi:MAG: Trm112 family protein [Desulfatibacillaceae bacterium]|nr:Trm112 family protein [Desulfatibacillaceae bacterium]
MPIEQRFVEIIVCPGCRGKLELSEVPQGLVCQGCQLFFPIRNDIPIMLIDEARPLADIKNHEHPAAS